MRAAALERPHPAASQSAAAQPPMLQRRCACGGQPGPDGECAACKQKRLDRKARGTAPDVVPPLVHDVLREQGAPLEPAVQAEMEDLLGHDFSRVRVHTDERAVESARAVSALAYTVGRDVVFDTARYAPHAQEGRKLLAHELTHVVQQQARDVDSPRVRVAHDDDPAETEAAALAERATSGARAARPSRSALPDLLLREPLKHSTAAPWDGAEELSVGLWEPPSLCISVLSPSGTYTHEADSKSRDDVFSERCSPIVCAGAPAPFEFLFHVDTVEAPRPQPFEKPQLSVEVELEPAAGEAGPENVLVSREFLGEYQGPGDRLKPSVDVQPWLVPSEAGTLFITARLFDPSSGMIVLYSDTLPVLDNEIWPLCPVAPERPSREGGTGYRLVVQRDAPLDYHFFGSYEYLEEGEEVVEVIHDEAGDYFWLERRKVRLPPDWHERLYPEEAP